MKNLLIIMLLFSSIGTVNAGDKRLESYISNFDYAARKEMKMDSKGLIKFLKEGKAQ